MFVVGADVGSSALLEVSSRLLQEGSARISGDVDSALLALRQSFALECEYLRAQDDGGRLCRSVASYCRALSVANHGDAPCEAVPVLIQARASPAHLEEETPVPSSFDHAPLHTCSFWLSLSLICSLTLPPSL